MDAEINFVGNLIENVKNQRCLYDKTHSSYYKRQVREKAWLEVSNICNESVADCKYRWKLLRERFGKEIKKNKPESIEWEYLQPLMFLKDSLGQPRTSEDLEDQVGETILDHSVCSADSLQDIITAPTPAKKKAKASFDSLCQKFGDTIERVERSFSTTEGNALDNAFLNTARCLMKELPETVKEDFQARMLQELYRLRRDNKSYTHVKRER